MITIDAILMGRITYDKLPMEQKADLKRLHSVLFDIETAYGKPFKVSSGYRTPEANQAAGGAKKSLHMVCKACDIQDTDGLLDKWISEHQDLLEKLGVWQEHPDATKGWCHLDIGSRAIVARPGCGKRQFRP